MLVAQQHPGEEAGSAGGAVGSGKAANPNCSPLCVCMVGDSFPCQNVFSGTLLSSDVWKTKVVKLCDGLGVVSRSAVSCLAGLGCVFVRFAGRRRVPCAGRPG